VSAPPARRRGRPGYDLESLLAVAVDVFNQRGYDGTSMEDLARRLGIGKSAIYHHVQSKEHLLQLALDRALDGLGEVAGRARALDGSAMQRLELLVYGSVEVLRRELPYVTLLLRVRGNTEVERAALERRRQFDRYAAALVRQAERDGDIRPDVDPAVTARLLFGMVNSVAEWYRPGPADADVTAAVCAVAFDGLRAGPAPRDPRA
jgi:AcrR family transcriptional regulator